MGYENFESSRYIGSKDAISIQYIWDSEDTKIKLNQYLASNTSSMHYHHYHKTQKDRAAVNIVEGRSKSK